MYLRDVVEEPRYSQDLDSFRKLYPIIDEVQSTLTWELSRNPTAGNALPFAPDFRLYKTTPYEEVPAFYILYSYDADKIYLHSMEPARED